jgi:Fe-S oxidoreductase
MCYMTKCPYVPPHPWNVDFPHLMLRAKAFKFSTQPVRKRDRILSATDTVGMLAGIPVVAEIVNAVNNTAAGRKLLDKALGVHPDAPVPKYHSKSYRKQHAAAAHPAIDVKPTADTKGRVVLFATCYGNRNEPDLGKDLTAIFEHNGIAVTLAGSEHCCGMPKLEIGDLESVARLKEKNIPELARLVDEGWDIVTPVPSCTLMFKQELPLMFPVDAQVLKVRDAMFDPFEYLWARYKGGLLRTNFTRKLGKISYHVPCHLRVQNLGLKTRDVLMLVPQTQVEPIERCSGHNGTYGVKSEYRDVSMKIGRPVIRRVVDSDADFYSSDCPMAGHQIESGLEQPREPTHPLKLLRMAYGI